MIDCEVIAMGPTLNLNRLPLGEYSRRGRQCKISSVRLLLNSCVSDHVPHRVCPEAPAMIPESHRSKFRPGRPFVSVGVP